MFWVVPPIAHSDMCSLPRITAPARSSAVVTGASDWATLSRIKPVEAVIRTPATSMLSFSAIGTPASGPGSAPARTCWSISRARARARSAITVR